MSEVGEILASDPWSEEYPYVEEIKRLQKIINGYREHAYYMPLWIVEKIDPLPWSEDG